MPTQIVRRFADAESRVDGNVKVSGRAAYAADIHVPGVLWAAFVTSPVPHARIVSIDVTAARAFPGVHAVLTGADIGPRRFGRTLMDWPVLAYEKVRFNGERVVAIAAITREIAEVAARLVDVQYDELPAVYEGSLALAADAPVLHTNSSDYRFLPGRRPPPAHPNIQGHVRIEKGDSARLDQIFEQADHVFEHRFTTPRQHAGFIEPHATVVWIDEDGTVHVHSTSKSPFALRLHLSIVAEIPPDRIVIEPTYVGGDFGGKGLVIDEFACYFLARASGRPVKSVMRYADELRGTNVRHRSEIQLRTAVSRDGRLLAHKADVLYNGGAYAAAKINRRLLPGGGNGFPPIPYRVPHSRIDVCTAYTNTVPAGNVRAPVSVQVVFAWESHVDMIARALGLDPLAFRLQNAIQDGETDVTDHLIHQPRAVEVLTALRDELAKRPPEGPNRGRGIALSCRHTGGGRTGVVLELTANGHIAVLVNVPDQGSGTATVLRRVVAEELGLDPSRVETRRLNTSDALEDPGSGASRVTHIVGGAALAGARVLRATIEERTGRAVDEPDFDALAAEVCGDGPIRVIGRYDSERDDPHSTDHACTAFAIDVDIDRDTGAFSVVDALLVTDVATIVNPLAHDGQVEGGFIYGLGGALSEELDYEDGQLTSASLAEYKLPTCRDIPPLHSIYVEAAPGNGPFGSKMAGELSNCGVAPAIANALFDAAGVRLATFPITAERVYQLLEITKEVV